MKYIVVLALIMLISPVAAQSPVEAGITPDSPLWKLDIAAERLIEMLANKGDVRTALQLNHADERIAEIQVSENKEDALEQYNNILNRINANENINYETSEMIRTRLMQHEVVLTSNSGYSNALAELNKLRTSTVSNENAVQYEEMVWWSNFISKYDITATDTSVLSTYGLNMDDVHKYIPDGITQVTITKRDGSTVNDYIVKHTESDITIQQGITTNPAQSYSISLSEMHQSVDRYGQVIGV